MAYWRIPRLLALLTALLLLAACGPQFPLGPGADEAPRDAGEVVLDMEDNGQRVEMVLGQVLVITLASNPTTGYRWELVESDWSLLKQEGEAEFRGSDTGDRPLVGAGGTETFRLRAIGSGQTAVSLAYLRPWEEGQEPLETFSIQAVIR
jgi:inhibitor of cysteine peptidase